MRNEESSQRDDLLKLGRIERRIDTRFSGNFREVARISSLIEWNRWAEGMRYVGGFLWLKMVKNMGKIDSFMVARRWGIWKSCSYFWVPKFLNCKDGQPFDSLNSIGIGYRRNWRASNSWVFELEILQLQLLRS